MSNYDYLHPVLGNMALYVAQEFEVNGGSLIEAEYGLKSGKVLSIMAKDGERFVCYRDKRRAHFTMPNSNNKYMSCVEFFNTDKIIISKARGWNLIDKDILKYFPDRELWMWGQIKEYRESTMRFRVYFTDQTKEYFEEEEIYSLLNIGHPIF